MNSTALLFVGTYSRHSSRGIYIYAVTSSGLRLLSTEGSLENPSYLALSPDKRYLYAVSETAGGSVASFTIDWESGKLSLCSRTSSFGADPCHLSLSPALDRLYVTNYTSGTISSFPLRDGIIGSMDKQNDKAALLPYLSNPAGITHVHCSFPTDGGLYYTDLGLDCVVSCGLDLSIRAVWPIPFGSGPRHLLRAGSFLYLVNEYANRLDCINPVSGQITGSCSMLPKGFHGISSAAALKFGYGKLLASTRGADVVAVCQPGEHPYVHGFLPSGGNGLRDLEAFPLLELLFTANEASDCISVFHVPDGAPVQARLISQADVPSPVCLICATYPGT